jgi:hypothetical protein
VTINVAKLRELHQPMYGHTGDPCSWCREWTPCPVAELLDAYEERDRLRVMLERLRNRMAEPDQPIIQWDAGTWIPRIDAALEGRE